MAAKPILSPKNLLSPFVVLRAMREESLGGQMCPMCRTKNLTLTEGETEIPVFGKLFLFSMRCSKCHYFKSDVEAAKRHPPVKYTFEVQGKDDLDARVVRSSEGKIKIPRIGEIEPGMNAEGFISNVEGVLARFKKQIEHVRDSEDDPAVKKKAKNMLKKIQKVIWGEEKLKIVIEDPSGNSAIVHERAVRSKL